MVKAAYTSRQAAHPAQVIARLASIRSRFLSGQTPVKCECVIARSSNPGTTFVLIVLAYHVTRPNHVPQPLAWQLALLPAA
jgi:hypothetical protein